METKLQLLSSTLRILHRQFYKTLILQVVTPTFTLFLPIMMVNILPFLNLHFDFPSGIFTSGLVLYPALDACIVIPRYIKKFFDGPRFIFPILYMLSGGSCWFLACFLFNQPDNYSLEYLGPDVYESYGVILSEQPLLLVVAYDKEGLIRFSNSFGLFLMASFLSIQYSIIIYCAVVMGLKMHKKLSILSSKMQQMHRQFYHALILQITTPTLTLFFPVFILYFVPYLDIEISFPTGTCLSAFALYPGMDILIMIYIASYYTQAMKGGHEL
ncbi:hypothetical protein L3Y34_006845 [Caenorhabditis briggsae]|uniref:Seven TM Receptor n=1 Tax=Caenorhabditis briggsae TaxID=6238 RepID=A0AAE8ZYR6_CAEBR|nr:hypothetical protein L3Y34_006845 [Caenorhabditis briggsae]